MHDCHLLFALSDDVLGDATKLLTMAIFELRPRNIDRALIMRDHRGDEILIDSRLWA
jgi:hypothetical protein